jgi:hypothetical protein
MASSLSARFLPFPDLLPQRVRNRRGGLPLPVVQNHHDFSCRGETVAVALADLVVSVSNELLRISPMRTRMSIGSISIWSLKSHSARATMKPMSVGALPPVSSNQSWVRAHSK